MFQRKVGRENQNTQFRNFFLPRKIAPYTRIWEEEFVEIDWPTGDNTVWQGAASMPVT